MKNEEKIVGQKKLILEYLKDGLSLTRTEAFKKGFGINLPARICDLRKMGFPIKTRKSEISKEKEYYLELCNA